MTGKFEYKLLYKYPHMKHADFVIWTQFILQYPTALDRVDYDVAVGEGVRFTQETDQRLAEGFEKLTKWKIDVVGFKDEFIFIIEIKPEARANALGQVLSYTELFKKDFPTEKNIKSVIITDSIEPNMIELSNKMGVLLVSVNQ